MRTPALLVTPKVDISVVSDGCSHLLNDLSSSCGHGVPVFRRVCEARRRGGSRAFHWPKRRDEHRPRRPAVPPPRAIRGSDVIAKADTWYEKRGARRWPVQLLAHVREEHAPPNE